MNEQIAVRRNNVQAGTGLSVTVKNAFKLILRSFGYELRRISAENNRMGLEPIRDIHQLLAPLATPLVFDVGANIGQSITRFRQYFPNSTIHAFEPTPDIFKKLEENCSNNSKNYLNNVAMGAISGRIPLYEHSIGSPMNSLREAGSECYGGGGISRIQEVDVNTVDNYCETHQIEYIDVLKTDAQGFDFEVIKGAKNMFAQRKVRLVMMEIIFCDMYKGIPRFDEIFTYLADHGFKLVTLYPFQFTGQKAAWADALFIQPNFDKSENI